MRPAPFRPLPSRPRPASTYVLGVFAALLAAFAATFVDAARLRAERAPHTQASIALTARLGLTDPVLMTEARYLRHPSQADLHAHFQDHPLAFDLFPGGSLLPPPRHAHLAQPSATAD